MIAVTSVLISSFLPVVMVAVTLAGLRLWRLLLTLGALCVSVFVVLFATVAGLDFLREPNPANAEPPLGLAGALLYATVVGIIVCDLVAVVGVPLLFLVGGQRFRGLAAAKASPVHSEVGDGP